MRREYATTYESADELRGIVDKAEELLKTIGADGGEIADELRARVGKTTRAARQRLGELGASAKETTTQMAEVADEYVTSYPWTAMAVAAAVGALVGVAVTRR